MQWFSLNIIDTCLLRRCVKLSTTNICIYLVLCFLLISPSISQEEGELCTDNDCTCNPQGETDLIEVICRCSPKRVSIFQKYLVQYHERISLT